MLLLKLARELWQRKASLGALMLVAAVGVSSYVSMISVYRDLDNSTKTFYRDYRLTDFTVDLKRAPRQALQQAAQVDNVRNLEGRVVMPARVMIPGRDEPLSGVVVSLPNPRRPIINDLLLTLGTWFSPGAQRETIINEAFGRANDLRPGDSLRVILLGQEQTFTVVGRARSPEYVYVLPPGGSLTPDPARAPVLYLPEDVLQEAADMEGAFNQLVGSVYDESPPVLRATLNELERVLDPYGVTLTTPAADLASVQFLQSDIQSLRVSSTIMPTICLGVVALVLNLVVGRLVSQQRTSIGTLRALGYTSGFIIRHYLGYGWAVGIGGGVLGVALGTWMQEGLLSVYRQFYELPSIRGHRYPDILVAGMLVSLVCALAGTVMGARSAARMEPADAMRPPPPEAGRGIFLERLPFLWSPLPFRWKMILRAVFRNPFRSGVTAGAAMLGTALVVESLSMGTAVSFIINHQFKQVSHQDVTINLRDPAGRDVLHEVQTLPGIGLVEPQLSVPSDISLGPRSKRTGVTGLPRNNRLYTPLDDAGRPVPIPERGLVLTRKLANVLGAEVGDTVRLRALIAERREVEAPVSAVVDTYLGMGAYASIEYLSRLIGEEWVTSSVLATTDSPGEDPTLLAQLNRRPMVLGADWRARSLQKMQETLDQSMGISLTVLIVFAGTLAFGSVLNTALVSLSERQREVGTLRVLGYTSPQVTQIFAGESFLVNGAGVVLGWGLGIWLVIWLSRAYDTELIRFPVIIEPIILLQSTLILFFFVALAQLIVYRLIKKLPWLDVLKIRE